MTLSSLHLVTIVFLFLLHWWFIWLLIRKRTDFVKIPDGPFYVILIPTMRGILHGYYTTVLSGHTNILAATNAASEACAEDHSGLLGTHYNIVMYDATENETYIKEVS